MPGIAGICTTAAERGLIEHALEGMLSRMARGSRAIARPSIPSEQALLGWIGRDGQSGSGQIASSGLSAIVFDGELYGVGASTNKSRENSVASRSLVGAQHVLYGYLQDGEKFLAGLEGRFTAALWDAERGQCVFFTDKFATKPLYFSHDGRRLAFASEIKALLTLPWVSSDLNRRGLVQFFSFGHLWNQDTFFTPIQCLDGATIATFEPGASELRMRRYWRPRSAARRNTAESLTELDECLKAAIDDRTRGVDHLGVSLSGGLDARTVLGLMEPQSTPATCVSLGMEGSLDQISARRLAELAGCNYQTFVLDQSFLSNFETHLQDMVELTDGHYLSQCIVMPTLPLYAKLGVQTLLRGHAGELVHMHKAYNFSIDGSVGAIQNEQMLHEWLFARLQSHLTDGVDEPLICGVSPADFKAIAHDSLRTALQETAHWDHPVDRISQLFLDQRTRRETAMSLAKFNSVVDLQLPYLDGRFVEAVFSSSPELRISDAIQTYILRKRCPAFLAPANSNTGAPVGAGTMRRTFCYYRMKVLAKLGVRGYQPYERLGLWLRRELNPTVERLLLSSECLDRGLLEPDAVRNVVRRHKAGERNHTFLVMAMMILETGMRRLAENPSCDAAETVALGELPSSLSPPLVANKSGTP